MRENWDKWESYIREVDQTAVEGKAIMRDAMLERCKRMYDVYGEVVSQGGGKRGGSEFTEFCKDRFGYAKSTVSVVKRLGERLPELSIIMESNRFATDWNAWDLFLGLDEDGQQKLLKSVPEGVEIGQTVVRAFKREEKRRREIEQARVAAERALEGVEVENVVQGDFREEAQRIPDDTVDLVFVDPPYDRESLPLYGYAAREAARILKPGGHFIVYGPTYALPQVLADMAQHLHYLWTVASVYMVGPHARMVEFGIVVQWKPIVWFVKGSGRLDKQSFVEDTILLYTKPEKGSHEWQQPEREAEYFIEKLCPLDGLVVDFFAGGGTTGAVAQRLGRKWVMFERDETAFLRASARVLGE